MAALSLEHKVPPRAVWRDRDRTEQFQQMLKRQGAEIEWPADLRLEDGDPHRHATS